MVDMKIRKALVLGSFWFCASFCIGAPVANTFLPVVPVPAEYSVGEGYFYFNADMKFGVENESQLFEQVKKLYPKAYTAVEKIEIYVKGKFNTYLSQDEYTYLMIHVNRVAERGDNNG